MSGNQFVENLSARLNKYLLIEPIKLEKSDFEEIILPR